MCYINKLALSNYTLYTIESRYIKMENMDLGKNKMEFEEIMKRILYGLFFIFYFILYQKIYIYFFICHIHNYIESI